MMKLVTNVSEEFDVSVFRIEAMRAVPLSYWPRQGSLSTLALFSDWTVLFCWPNPYSREVKIWTWFL